MCMAYFISYFKPYRGATDGAWYCESSAAIIYKKNSIERIERWFVAMIRKY